MPERPSAPPKFESPPPEALPPEREAEPGEAPEAPVENPPEANDFSHLPMPPTEEEAQAGRVLGGPRRAPRRPDSLPEYKETIVIGEKPPAPPPPPQPDPMQPPGGDMEQTMAAPAAPVPQAPAVDQEIIAAAQAQAQEILAQAQHQLQEAQMQAQQIVEQAVAQAQQAAEEARQQAGQQGYQEGIQAGLVEGRQAGQVELQQMINSLKFQFVDIVKLRRKILVGMEPEIVRLAWDVAKRVVGEELKTNREIIVGVVRSALYTLQERDEILIRVNPNEFESVKAYQTEFEAMIEGLKKFIIQPDGAIELGSCAIETNLGNVDARIDTQFEAIRLGLEEMANIRQFEMSDQLAAQPVEVPGDPDFEARMKEQQHAPEDGAHEGHGGHGEAVEPHQEMPPQEIGQGEEMPQQMEGLPPEMELLPHPTEELLATLTPEEQQQYIEAYQQQQAYLEHLQQGGQG